MMSHLIFFRGFVDYVNSVKFFCSFCSSKFYCEILFIILSDVECLPQMKSPCLSCACFIPLYIVPEVSRLEKGELELI